MKCNACGSEQLQLIKVFAGSNQVGWSPVSGEKDIWGNYKKLRPLLAHACSDCGNVQWNIKVDQPRDADKTAAALDELSEIAEHAVQDAGMESVAYSFDEELN